MRSSRGLSGNFKALLLFGTVLFIVGCSSMENHITLVNLPQGKVAGVATEKGVLILKKPVVKMGDIYPIEHTYGNSVVIDEARVVHVNEYLALLEPLSSRLNTTRFHIYPMEPEEELYVGILDNNAETHYLMASLLDGGAKGDLVICNELNKFPEPTLEGYGGIGLFAYKQGAMWLTGLLIPLTVDIKGIFGGNIYPGDDIYAFVGGKRLWDFIPDLQDNFDHKPMPFRPDFIYGVERDGTGE